MAVVGRVLEGVWGVGGAGREGDPGGMRGTDGEGGALRFSGNASVDPWETLSIIADFSFAFVVGAVVDVETAVVFAFSTGVDPLIFLRSDKSLVARLPTGAITFFAELPGRFNGSNVFFTGVVDAREVEARGDAMDFRPDALLVLADVEERSSRHFLNVMLNTGTEVADVFCAAEWETRGWPWLNERGQPYNLVRGGASCKASRRGVHCYGARWIRTTLHLSTQEDSRRSSRKRTVLRPCA